MAGTYYSKSRGALVEISEMPTPHLARAAKKLAKDVDGSACGNPEACEAINAQNREAGGWLDVLSNMIDELASRVPPASAPPAGSGFGS